MNVSVQTCFYLFMDKNTVITFLSETIQTKLHSDLKNVREKENHQKKNVTLAHEPQQYLKRAKQSDLIRLRGFTVISHSYC